MPSKIFSAAIFGLDARPVEIETVVSRGLRQFTIVGLPDKAVEESKERVAAALRGIGFLSPYSHSQRILVNLAPADLKKEGSIYDLPIALGYLVASQQLKFSPEGKIFVGELSLDGTLRPVKGILAFALMAQSLGFSEIILPKTNALEAALSSFSENKTGNELKIIGVENLKGVIGYLTGKMKILPARMEGVKDFEKTDYELDLAWIKGQELAKRALEIAATGSHNLLMLGPPGAGKSLLAKAICSILPELSPEETLELTKIYSIAGLLPDDSPLVIKRPFRSPHHSSSEIALIGGGNPPRPGEITLAHRGVLFLDEFPEFHRDVLESLRQPLEDGRITILRAGYRMELPSRFSLIAASNPCPCGYYGDPEKECRCGPSQIQKYRRKLSGPLIDRIDLFISVNKLKYEKLTSETEENCSEKTRRKVKTARNIQRERFSVEKKDNLFITNSEMKIPDIKRYCQIDNSSHGLLKKYIDSGRLSARGYHRVLKVARTIADLEGSKEILYQHLSEALMYRIRDLEY